MHQHSNYRGPRRRRERVWEKFWKILVENFPNMEKETVNQAQEAQWVPYRINPRRNTPRHTLIKLKKTKHKERRLKAARDKQQVAYNGNPICLTADLLTETLQSRREWQDIFKVLKGKNLWTLILDLDLIQNWWRNQKLFKQSKVKIIQYRQTSFTTNVKRTYVVKKYKRRKKIYKINLKQLRKWQ